jgi:hypothetical protein
LRFLTQRVELDWRPALGFFETRSDLLKSLDADGLFDAFDWAVSEVTVRVGDHQTVRIGSNGATCFSATRTTECERVRQILKTSMESIKPVGVGLRNMRIQALIPMDADLREACAALATEMIGDGVGTSTDIAVLSDGISDRLRATYKVEFGILGPEELSVRLEGRLGRIQDQPFPVGLDLDELPGCAFFFDWSWNIWRQMDENSFGGIVETWSAVMDETERLSREVYARHNSGIIEAERLTQ